MNTQRKLLGVLMALSLAVVACSDEPTSSSNPSDRSMAPADQGQEAVQVPVRAPLRIPVTGELADGGTFRGVATITEFGINQTTGVLSVTGVLRGIATTSQGARQNIDQTFTTTAQLTQQNPTECQILFLDIGPIFLDLLGLQVDLSQIILDITAVAGPGNLLGNLLCGLVGLLDNFPGSLADILDQLLDINQLL
jgi:hypothetical protein